MNVVERTRKIAVLLAVVMLMTVTSYGVKLQYDDWNPITMHIDNETTSSLKYDFSKFLNGFSCGEKISDNSAGKLDAKKEKEKEGPKCAFSIPWLIKKEKNDKGESIKYGFTKYYSDNPGVRTKYHIDDEATNIFNIGDTFIHGYSPSVNDVSIPIQLSVDLAFQKQHINIIDGENGWVVNDNKYDCTTAENLTAGIKVRIDGGGKDKSTHNIYFHFYDFPEKTTL